MEKNIPTTNDVITFVEKAMKENLDIEIWRNTIVIRKTKDKSIEIDLYEKENSICISKYGLNPLRIKNLSKLDVLSFKYLSELVVDYSSNKALEYFNNFFDEENSKPTDINDLDNEDD